MTVQKASGLIQAACLVHGYADRLREQYGSRKMVRWLRAAELIDEIADSLKGLAVVVRDEPEKK